MPWPADRQQKTLENHCANKGNENFWGLGSKKELSGNFHTLYYRHYTTSMQIYSSLPLHAEESRLQKINRRAWGSVNTVIIHVRGECEKSQIICS
ncbi:hypothetical protein [Scytonema sp. NUACC21]